MKALIAAVLVLASASSHAYMSGTKLSERLDAAARLDAGTAREGDERNAVYLYGYIAGIHDLGDQIVFCTPDTSTMRQIRLVVHSYIKVVPERLNLRAEALVTEALSTAFPCERRRSQPL